MGNTAQRSLILASASPRRREMLHSLGYRFEVLAADIDESPLPGEQPPAHVQRLALGKATVIAAQHPAVAVLAADTIVVQAGRILGKPRDAQHAASMLAELSGTRHQVHTALALIVDGQPRVELQSSWVQFRDLHSDEITAYVASGEPMDKAGAYGIQGQAGRFVREMQGSYTGIMGLPLCQTEQLLRGAGLRPDGL